MSKAVFIESRHSHYSDRPGEVYHFPNRNYLSLVQQTIGDWVIFYEGRRGGGRGYHRVQKVEAITPDPADPTYSFALLDRSSAWDFETELPREKADGSLWETGLARMGGNNTSAVRLIPDRDFAAIVNAGLSYPREPDTLPREGDISGFYDPPAPFTPQAPQRVERGHVLTSRLLRDQSFSRLIRRTYAGRCAFSGLELRNGGGRPEVEAAHILPVAERGPDTVDNGLALSGTLHWMFDRGLLSLADDQSILIAKGSIAEDAVQRLILPSGKAILPARNVDRPNPAYLAWHRQHVFKG